MSLKKKLPLIGGPCHGESVEVDEKAIAVELDIHTTPQPFGDPLYTEMYARQKFSGEEFGEGFECFVSPKDDDVEARELARWTKRQMGDRNPSVREAEEIRAARALDLGRISDEIGRISRRFQMMLKSDDWPAPEDIDRLKELRIVLARLEDEEKKFDLHRIESHTRVRRSAEQ